VLSVSDEVADGKMPPDKMRQFADRLDDDFGSDVEAVTEGLRKAASTQDGPDGSGGPVAGAGRRSSIPAGRAKEPGADMTDDWDKQPVGTQFTMVDEATGAEHRAVLRSDGLIHDASGVIDPDDIGDRYTPKLARQEGEVPTYLPDPAKKGDDQYGDFSQVKVPGDNATDEEYAAYGRALKARAALSLSPDEVIASAGGQITPPKGTTRQTRGKKADELDLEFKGSSASLDRSPKQNWIEAVGGELPPYVREVARSIEKTGKSLSAAIRIAIGRIKTWAHGGGNVKPDTIAKAQAAVAQWEALKAKAGAKYDSVLLEEIEHKAAIAWDYFEPETKDDDELEAKELAARDEFAELIGRGLELKVDVELESLLERGRAVRAGLETS
jgi:hypothetical protein